MNILYSVSFVIKDIDVLFITSIVLEAEMEPVEFGIRNLLLSQVVNVFEPLERQIFLFWVVVQYYDDSVFNA